MVEDAADTIVVRAARADEALALSVLSMQVFLDTYATEGIDTPIAREALNEHRASSFEQALAEREAAIIVAERAQRLLGYVHIRRAPWPAHLPACPALRAPYELYRLYVQRPFQGQRLGVRLMRAACQRARADGADGLWLSVWAGNQRALAFYARQGWADVGHSVYTFEGATFDNRVLMLRLP